MEPLLAIIKATYLHDYVLQVTFSNAETVEVNLSPMIENKPVLFSPLKKIDFFKNFHVDYTLCWDNEIDVAPEYIYFLAHKDTPEYQTLFKEWGYI